MSTIDLTKYGITDVKEILHNPSYEVLFAEETKAELEGYEKGQLTELDTVSWPFSYPSSSAFVSSAKRTS